MVILACLREKRTDKNFVMFRIWRSGMPLIDTKQFRVMHVVPTLHSCGGAEQLVYRMVRSMLREQFSPIVCCIHSLGDLGLQLQKEGVKVYCRQQRSTLDLGLIFWMRRIIREEGVQIIHAHMYAAFQYSVPAALLFGNVKVVYTVHGRLYPEKRTWKRRILNPLWSLGVEHFVSISEKTREAMVYYDFHPKMRIRVIHNGIQTSTNVECSDIQKTRLSMGLDEKSSIVGTAARLEDIKNISMMLRAVKRVLEVIPDLYLLIAGDGTKTRDLKGEAEKLGVSQRVKFIGLRDDLEVIYPLFDIFLLTSFTEGISVSLLEAMSHGVPAVVTDVGGNPEVIVEEETGYLVPSDDDALMAVRILELLKDKEMAAEFGKNSRERVMQHFSFQGMMDEYMKLYRTMSEDESRLDH
jgi:L-malate glycosyltransferase